MFELVPSPWWIVSLASAPSLSSAIWVVGRWWVERSDKRTEGETTREQTLIRDLEQQRAALSREQTDLFSSLRDEYWRIQQRLIEIERDRDRAWDLARWWNSRAHDLRYAGTHAQAMVEGFCSRDGLEPPAWPNMDLPNFEEPT